MLSPNPRRATWRGGRPGFSWRRLYIAFARDEVRVVEILVALFFFLLRGAFLIQLGFNYPGVEDFLHEVELSEGRLGLACVMMGVLHILAAGTDYRWARIAVAGLGTALGLLISMAFRHADPSGQPIVMVWVTVVCFEFYVMVRNFGRPQGRRRASP